MKTDLEKLQGTWNIVELEMDGLAMGDSGDARIVVKGERFTTVSMGAAYEGTVRVDEAQSPKTLDLKFTKGPEKGNVNYGIYELDGDTWKICLNTQGKRRPKKFTTSGGSGLALEILKRGRAKAKKVEIPLPDFTVEPAPELEGEWVMVSCVQSGQALEDGYLKFGKRVAKDNETTVTMAGRVQVKARYTVDRTKKPMTMDYFLAGGATQLGIYELDGKTLKVCFAKAGKERPKDFASARGDGR
ncbi:MAG TPA: TIGR03067 domain-containing protein, partial [Bryobacteraceae bacterium]|nr:TIGR03067 domain-containing protein [Bryobacteraceae bacterium]